MAYSAVPIVCLMRLVSQRLGYRVGRLSPDPTGFLEKTKNGQNEFQQSGLGKIEIIT